MKNCLLEIGKNFGNVTFEATLKIVGTVARQVIFAASNRGDTEIVRY